MFDVSGRHGPHHDLSQGHNQGQLENITLIRIADVVKNIRPLADEGPRDSEQTTGASAGVELSADEPVSLHVWREQTDKDVLLINILPSMKSSPAGAARVEECRIGPVHSDMFMVTSQLGVNSIRFTNKVTKKQKLELRVTCSEVTDHVVTPDVISQPFVIVIEIFML